jgi:hypothetical protein
MAIEHTLQAWATAMGCERRTLETRLVKSGYDKPRKKGQKIPFKVIYNCIMGDEQAEKVRGMKLDNDQKEREAAEEIGDLVRWGDVEKFITENVIAPLRPALTSIDTTLDVRCNPQNPEVARTALRQWSDETLKLCSAQLLQKKKKAK